MVKMQVVYEGEFHTMVTHCPSNETLHTDAPVDNGGTGNNFSPTDLLAASFASCVATVLGLYAEKKKIDLRGMKLEVEKEMTKEGPRRVKKLDLQIWMPISLTDEEKKKMEHVATTCPVSNSLHPEIEEIIRFHWKENA